MPAQAGIHENSELRSVAKGVWLDALVACVDPSLRWDDEVRGVVGPPLEPPSKGFAFVASAALWMG